MPNPSLVNRIVKRALGGVLMRRIRVSVESFSGARFRLTPRGLAPATDGDGAFHVIARSIVRRRFKRDDGDALHVDVTLRIDLQALRAADPTLHAAILAYIDEPAERES